MKQKNYSNADAQYLCDVCSEAVTNPLCPSCITAELEAWTTLYPDLRQKLLPRIQRYLNELENKRFDSTMCIKCSDKRASVCPYCFTERILRELKKLKVAKQIKKEFLEFFNFDFDHNGYSTEAEMLGVI